MAIRAITNGLHSKIQNDKNFKLIFNDVIVNELIKLVSSNTVTDYCIFINIDLADKGSKIVFHDGGATYDEETDEMKYTNYLILNSEIPLERTEILYYCMTEQILCFLEER